MACDRCDKTGDLACVQIMDDHNHLYLALALHKDGTVELPDTSDKGLHRLLGFVTNVWLETAYLLTLALTGGVQGNREELARAAEAGFLKLRYYSTMEGGVREWMRAHGRPFPEDASMPGVTQAPGRA